MIKISINLPVIIGTVVIVSIIVSDIVVIIHIIDVIHVLPIVCNVCSTFIMLSTVSITFVQSSTTVTVSFAISFVNVTCIIRLTLCAQVSFDGHELWLFF